jgi:signal transduction histidine kinase
VQQLRFALLPIGIALGLAAEWVFYETGELELAIADFAVGCILIGCGIVAWERRPESRVGLLMALAGFTWFLGNFGEVALFLHRGPLVHLLLSYPTGRLPTRLARAVASAAYLVAAVEPLADNDWLTLALSGGVAVTAGHVFLGTSGPARKAGGPALAAALAFATVLALGAVGRLAGWDADRAVLWAYDLVIASVALVLLTDLLRGRWAAAVITGLVVDLGGQQEPATLRGKLAHALGDPSLVIGYRLPESGAFVDDAGRPVELPSTGSGRAVTTLDEHGEQVAVLVHDEGLLADRNLVDSVAAAARIAVANARLQAEARARAAELEASRRRIIDAADAQRRRLERQLRLGAEQRLDSVAALLAAARSSSPTTVGGRIEALESELDDARSELREFAHGVHPAALTDSGLMPALSLLAERSAIPVRLSGTLGRLPGPVEATLFFICSEALANVAKHAAASRVSIELREEHERVVAVIFDDGVGGADTTRGSGLRGLVDRVQALGGQLKVESPPGAGTRLVAELPRGPSGRTLPVASELA